MRQGRGFCAGNIRHKDKQVQPAGRMRKIRAAAIRGCNTPLVRPLRGRLPGELHDNP